MIETIVAVYLWCNPFPLPKAEICDKKWDEAEKIAKVYDKYYLIAGGWPLKQRRDEAIRIKHLWKSATTIQTYSYDSKMRQEAILFILRNREKWHDDDYWLTRERQ